MPRALYHIISVVATIAGHQPHLNGHSQMWKPNWAFMVIPRAAGYITFLICQNVRIIQLVKDRMNSFTIDEVSSAIKSNNQNDNNSKSRTIHTSDCTVLNVHLSIKQVFSSLKFRFNKATRVYLFILLIFSKGQFLSKSYPRHINNHDQNTYRLQFCCFPCGKE